MDGIKCKKHTIALSEIFPLTLRSTCFTPTCLSRANRGRGDGDLIKYRSISEKNLFLL